MEVDLLEEDDDDLWNEVPDLQRQHEAQPGQSSSRQQQKQKSPIPASRFAIKPSTSTPRQPLRISQLLGDGRIEDEASADLVESSSEEDSQGFRNEAVEAEQSAVPLQQQAQWAMPDDVYGADSFRTSGASAAARGQDQHSARFQLGGSSTPAGRPQAGALHLHPALQQPPLSAQRSFLASNLPPVTPSAAKASAAQVRSPKGGGLAARLQAVLRQDAVPEAAGQLIVSVERSAMEGHVLKAWCSADVGQSGCDVPGPEFLVLFNTNPRLEISLGSRVGIQHRWQVLQGTDFPIVFAQHAVVLTH